MKEKKLVLFDVDGVLIKERFPRDGLKPRFNLAIEEVFRVDTTGKSVDTRGMIDGAINMEIARLSGISEAEVIAHSAELFEIEARIAAQRIKELKPDVQEGVRETLSELKRRGHVLGLLTGNLPKIAETKLRSVELWDFFKVGGFGDQFGPRSGLIADAIAATAKLGMNVEKKDVFYLGDTPRDIAAGKEAGVNVIGVATGSFSTAQLEQHKPYAVLDSLRDPQRVVELIDPTAQGVQ